MCVGGGGCRFQPKLNRSPCKSEGESDGVAGSGDGEADGGARWGKGGMVGWWGDSVLQTHIKRAS